MSPADYHELHPWHQKHHLQCEECGEYFDCRDISDVLFHRTHEHQPDVQTGRGVNQARLCAIQHWFVHRMANDSGTRWEQAFHQWAETLSEHERAVTQSFLEDCQILSREPAATVFNLIMNP